MIILALTERLLVIEMVAAAFLCVSLFVIILVAIKVE